MKEKIRVIVKEPGKNPEARTVSNTLEALQELVGGYIEHVPLALNMGILCNEEGKIMGMQENCRICGEIFVGTIALIGSRGEEFTDCPMSLEQSRWLLPAIWRDKP